MKVYARKKKIFDEKCNSMYFNYNIATAAQGFHEMGFEIIDYFFAYEIFDKYEKGDIALDGIQQVKYLLSKFNIETKDVGYPDVLKPFLGRRIWTDTINNINSKPELWPVFVKSIDDKIITGTLIETTKDLVGCGSCYKNEAIYCSEPVKFIYECRGFIYYDNLIDLRPYKGNYIHMNKINTEIIKEAIDAFKTQPDRPAACSLDFGVTDDARTLLIEQNSAYSLGCYGLHSTQYAKMISACISQLSETEDECNFNIE